MMGKVFTKKEIGDKGEEIIAKLLIDRGHTILERNWRYKHLEIDLITISYKGIHFVEVKSRVAPIMVLPHYNVRRNKMNNIYVAAKFYLNKMRNNNYATFDVHFDVASIIFKGNQQIIDYIDDAFIPIII